MLLNQPDDLDENGPNAIPLGADGGDSAPPPPAAAPPVDPITAIKQAQADADQRKAMLGVGGAIMQGLVNAPSAYELYTGKKIARPDVKAITDAAAAGIQNPMDQQQKAFAYLKAKNEANQAQNDLAYSDALKDPNSKESMALKQLAPRWGIQPTQDMPGTDILRMIDPKKMMETEAKANVDYNNEAKLKQMEFGERAKDRALDRGLKKQEMDLQRFKTQGETDPARAQAIIDQAGPNADPATLVKFLVPEHHQQKAYDEIDAAQNTARNAPNILKAFDAASHNMSHLTDYVPGTENADQKAYQAMLGPTFKDVEGTVRQAAMDNMFSKTTPQFGDSAATIAKKREALVNYMKSKSAAPIVAGYNMPLSKFNSTTFDDSIAADDSANPLKDAAKKEIERRKKTAAANASSGDGG